MKGTKKCLNDQKKKSKNNCTEAGEKIRRKKLIKLDVSQPFMIQRER